MPTVTQSQLQLYRHLKSLEKQRLLLRKQLLALLDEGAEVEEGEYAVEVRIHNVFCEPAGIVAGSGGTAGGHSWPEVPLTKEVKHLIIRHRDE